MNTDQIHAAAERLAGVAEDARGEHDTVAAVARLLDAVAGFSRALAAATEGDSTPKPCPFEVDPDLRAAFNDPEFFATFQPMRTKAVLASEWEKLQSQLAALEAERDRLAAENERLKTDHRELAEAAVNLCDWMDAVIDDTAGMCIDRARNGDGPLHSSLLSTRGCARAALRGEEV